MDAVVLIRLDCCRFDLSILMELIAGSFRWCTYHFSGHLGKCGFVVVRFCEHFRLR